MKKTEKYFITEGKRSIWQIVLASILLTSFFVLLISIIIEIPIDHFRHLHYLKPKDYAYFLSQTLIFGLGFSVIHNVYFDLDNRRFKKEIAIGLLKFGKWKVLPEIEYVSIFTVETNHEPFRYDINLWYASNQHDTIYQTEFFNTGIAFEMAYNIAKKLEIDLLNATIFPYEWMDLSLNYDELFKQIV